MDKEYIRRRLPEAPPPGLLEWAEKKLANELGHELCIFKAERMAIPATIEEIMYYQSAKPRKSVWAASCTCTACQEDFITAKEPGADNILLLEGEDGSTYLMEPWGEEADIHTYQTRQKPGDTFLCPYCGTEVELVHSKKMRNGRTNQVLVISVENVEGYTGIFYWMVRRTISEWGLSEYSVMPRDAYILTERGGLTRYSHTNGGGYFGVRTSGICWRLLSGNSDTFDQKYFDYGSYFNRKVGGAVYPVYPDLEGTTGEKTGLIEFLKADGGQPVQYLKLWRRYRGLENLCRCGQGKLIDQLIDRRYFASGFAHDYLDLSKKKPHEMLRMNRADFKKLRKEGAKLEIDILESWKRYKKVTGNDCFTEFRIDLTAFTQSGLNAALDCIKDYPGTTTERLATYMQKQSLQCKEVGLLLDTRRMSQRLYLRPLTNEELWPRRLVQVHDQVAQMLADREKKENAILLKEGFQMVIDRYGEIEWTDGDLCIRLPRSNEELVNEGEVLRHCVGNYGRKHAKGTSVILFVRRYRRPERPYYTLNISFNNPEPKEIQLHGYGNERHGPNKEYTHRIPDRVRDFCDRWEREILLPWWRNQKTQGEKTA